MENKHYFQAIKWKVLTLTNLFEAEETGKAIKAK